MSQKTTGLAAGVKFGQAELFQARFELVADHCGLRQSGEIAFDIGQEDRHAEPRKALGHHHQRYGFSCAGRAGDHAVAIAVARLQEDVTGVWDALAEQNFIHDDLPDLCVDVVCCDACTVRRVGVAPIDLDPAA
jgi:hypothetical protein